MDALWIASPYSAEKKQADRILFGYGGDRLCKYSTTGGAIAHQKNTLDYLFPYF
jgi:uncharacterized protein YycO